jgi:hypothetical protein
MAHCTHFNNIFAQNKGVLHYGFLSTMQGLGGCPFGALALQ